MNTAMVGSRLENAVCSPPTLGRRPSQVESEAAERTLIEWADNDPKREGLTGTPDRMARAYEEFFARYREDPLETAVEEATAYDELIVLWDICLESHCEHPIVPTLGKAPIADTIQKVLNTYGVVIEAAAVRIHTMNRELHMTERKK